MSRFLVRVELADRPGALGAVASRIGAVRGDVVGLEILDRRGGRALDDFLVDLPDDSVELLCSEIEEVDGAVVEAVHAVEAVLGDARREAYDGAAALLAQRSPEGTLQLLAGLARRELAAAWSAVVDTGTATGGLCGDGSAGRFTVLCADGPAPAGCWPSAQTFEGDGPGSLPSAEFAWAPLSAWDLALAAGRPGRPFVGAERERLAALARLGDARWAEISMARPHTEHRSPVG